MRKIFRWFFRKEIDKYQEDYKDRYNEFEKELKQIKRRYDLVQRIFTIEKNIKIIGLEKNKNKEDIFVCERIEKNAITIKLYGNSYQGISGNPIINAKLHKKENMENSSYYIEIIDILMVDNEVGNGSIAMKYFLEQVDKMKTDFGINIDYISGMLSWVDMKHFNRSEHYYKKFGFEVNFNEDKSSGKIKKQLL